jgi:hypothetical protein
MENLLSELTEPCEATEFIQTEIYAAELLVPEARGDGPKVGTQASSPGICLIQ